MNSTKQAPAPFQISPRALDTNLSTKFFESNACGAVFTLNFDAPPGRGRRFRLPLPMRPSVSQIASRVRGTWRYESPPGSIYVRRLYHRCSFSERGPCSVRNLAILRIPAPVTMTWFYPSYEWPVLRACSFCCQLPLGVGLYPRAATGNPSIRTLGDPLLSLQIII